MGVCVKENDCDGGEGKGGHTMLAAPPEPTSMAVVLPGGQVLTTSVGQ